VTDVTVTDDREKVRSICLMEFGETGVQRQEENRYLFRLTLRKDFHDHFWTFIGSIIGLGSVAFLALPMHLPLLAGSFGASAVLLYSLPHSPLAHPKNVLGGHMISALIGVICFRILGLSWISLTLAGTLAILAMRITHTTHPPGGATALIAVMSKAGFWFLLMPIGLGALILTAVAYLINNLAPHRTYPTAQSAEKSDHPSFSIVDRSETPGHP